MHGHCLASGWPNGVSVSCVLICYYTILPEYPDLCGDTLCFESVLVFSLLTALRCEFYPYPICLFCVDSSWILHLLHCGFGPLVYDLNSRWRINHDNHHHLHFGCVGIDGGGVTHRKSSIVNEAEVFLGRHCIFIISTSLLCHFFSGGIDTVLNVEANHDLIYFYLSFNLLF
ncbi:hypothetical protein BP00DRAFT_156906 [Aspergillus indologenus CBS 114.80]|uniref:Uncharacterized protein n=1 Tax=Aspergillus indologenus CBS 114.80 TaxID=1450541 RepID=A0A2V5I6L5_9EURO|nr:hypothetical protein BP00DRAFT_156906 [Aspergillus indologenus CBS 114.80]